MDKCYSGVITAGVGRARTLGYPTINIPLPGSNLSGVYAGEVIAGGTRRQAAVFADSSRKILEAHVLNFSGTLSGEATIELHKKIRDHKIFTDDEELRAAIAEDIRTVRAYFA